MEKSTSDTAAVATSTSLPKLEEVTKTDGSPGATAQVQPLHPTEGSDNERTVLADVANPVLIATEHGAEEQTAQSSQTSQIATETSVAAINNDSGILQETMSLTEEPLTQEEMVTKYGPLLVGDMNDAELMLSYATRNGLEDGRSLTEETIKSLIVARHHFRHGNFSCENEEAQFRTNYGLLAKAVSPVTVASLRDSLPNEQRRFGFFFKEREPRSNAERSCFQYRNLAMSVLILLVLSQVYWTICSSLLDKIALPGTGRENPTSAATVATTPNSGNPTVDKEMENDLMGYRVAMLANWMTPFLDDNTALRLRTFQPPKSSISSTPDQSVLKVDYGPYASVCVVAEQVIAVIQAWWLPLLYGGLGAAVYVVRTLSVQARDRLFRKEGLVALHMRFYLGMIGGLAIGWFWKDIPKQGDSLAELSPFALAFVAGYGVELFFTLLDKIVTTFTNRPL